MKYLLLTLWVASVSYYLNAPILPGASALRKPYDIEEYMLEDQGGQRKKNFKLEKDLIDVTEDSNRPVYSVEPFDETDSSGSEELPALIEDYANLIKNDIVLLDNSIETRTRKRGNIKFKRFSETTANLPCSCEFKKEVIHLGADYYPSTLTTVRCNKDLCPYPNVCRERLYDVTVLQRGHERNKQEELPSDLKHRWIAVKKTVVVGCECFKDLVDPN